MEQRFGHDFSKVRVHSGAPAEMSARDMNAHAYTVGHHIVFAAGQFAPGTQAGQRLIAHELTHVVQQSGSDGVTVDKSDEQRGLSPISREQGSAAEHLADATANDAVTDALHAPIVGTGLAIARKPRTGATAAAPPAVKEMTREEARTVLVAYVAAAGADDTLAAMDAIVAALRMPFTLENASTRLRLLTAAFSLVDEGGAATVLAALTEPVGARQKHLHERFGRLDSDFRTPLLEILRKRASAKPAREGEQAAESSKVPSLNGKATWIELDQGVFAYLVNAGMTVNDVAAYLSGHPDLPNILAKLNNVSRATPLEEGHPVIVSIDFIDREQAIREMPEHVRSRIASARPGRMLHAQHQRLMQVRTGHPLGPGAFGLIPLTQLTIRQIGTLPVAVIETLKYPAGFIVGLLEGAWDAIADLFVGAADMIKTVGKMLYDLVTGNLDKIWKMLMGWVKMLQLAWKNRGEIAADFMDKWEAKDDWIRGRFQGKVLGWVMMTALIVIVTAGQGAIAQISGKWKFVIDALKLAERAGDLGTYVRAAGKLPGKAADVVRSKLVRQSGQVTEEVEEAAERIVKEGKRSPIGEAFTAIDTAREWAMRTLKLSWEITKDLTLDAINRLRRLPRAMWERISRFSDDVKRWLLGCASPCEVDMDAIMRTLDNLTDEEIGRRVHGPPDKPAVDVDPRARGYALEDRHIPTLEVEGYERLPDWFKTHDAVRGGTVRNVIENGKRIKVIERPDAVSVKSTNITEPKKLTAKVTEDLNVLRGRFEYTRGNVRVAGVRQRRLDLIFEEGSQITAETVRTIEQLQRSAGKIKINWYVMKSDRKFSGLQYLRDEAKFLENL